ncbi:DNA repair protein RecN (Recombination protein N) [Arthrobacter sp. V4I6]|uniref:DNA repair protein RecN n=1 Tax=unclassified Arthrobacter TaxID=235627 RepID=UPI00277EC8B4|nr:MULTISPECIES: DNA repair protein RecN [unclassified Arthrobacter]MDQ0821822.1 DNA repair protein RecN (Recombination protein N) [Arthrobacter sp. V1I7]MDQ0856088.1 DNA repair protein RecN (Recombination protein N) [Arthrobacter sp. V4I6]
MLEELRIRDLGVITDATLPLGPGLSVVTGETGAGKTMVVTAVGLLLGARSDAGAVRSGAKSASAEAIVKLDSGHAAVARAREAGADVEEFDGGAELLLARSVGADGRSRAYLGGRVAPVGVLAEVGETLVVVHGQSEQIRLKSPVAQRGALDKFAGESLARTLAAYQKLHGHWKAIQAELDSLRSAARERLREAESLEGALAEIDAVDPQPGEDELLKAEAVKLANVEELRIAATTAHQALIAEDFGEGSDATALVDAAKRTLEHVAEHDEELGSAAARLAEVGFLLNDIATELASYQASLDTEGPERLAEIEDRRAALAKLVRKYAPSIDEVLVWAGEARGRYEELQDDSTRIEALDADVTRTEAELRKQAAAISKSRRKAAKDLSGRVSAELKALAMADATLVINVDPGEQLGPFGADDISFLLQPHAGAPARPLGKGASGGELSRVMLAIEVVLAAVDPVPTFVFDEVDAGVGGRAAVEIGRRLAMLARHVQVLVVTHLPQVAAFADQHIRVTKTSVRGADGATATGFTSSDVQLLDADERVRELARMLAGQEDSESAQAHAQELLDDARLLPQQA